MPTLQTYQLVFRQNRQTFYFLLLVLLLQVLFTSALSTWVVLHTAHLKQFSCLAWFALYALFAVAMSFSLLPNSFVAFASGFFLQWVGLPFFIVSYGLALCLGFWVCSQIDRGNFSKSLVQLPQIQNILTALSQNAWLLVVLFRISPIMPFAFVNQILYSVGIPFRVFLVASTVGVLPRMVLLIGLGNTATSLLSLKNGLQWENWHQITQLVLLIGSIFGVGLLLKKAINKAKKLYHTGN
jgi:uncharacterized membrane protein YdjX (TVP38/TMEM64 family)